MSGTPLQQMREALGFSQRELDRRAGLPRGTVRELETGRNSRPSWFVVARIVTALREAGLTGVTPEQLFPVPATEKVA